MVEIFKYLKNISDGIAQNYHLNLGTFLVIYFISYIPFYFGYFLIIYGTTRKVAWKDIFCLNIKGKLQWTEYVTAGLFIHIFGRIMPYAYIAIWGKDLPIFIYVIVWGTILISILFFLYKFFSKKPHSLPDDIQILKKTVVIDVDEVEHLWKIYNDTFIILNKMSPCKQSLDHEHFKEILGDNTVSKYILYKKDFASFGIALITNDFKNTPWISSEYFQSKFPYEFSLKRIYYFIGLAIDKDFRGNKFSISLIEKIIDDLPKDVVLGFDHSKNINPRLHFFTRIVKQARYIEKEHIDQQHYHTVKWKK